MKKEKIVLIIEDDRTLMEALKFELDYLGINVESHLYGEGAYEKTLKIKPDLILLDLVLPGMSGFDILEKVKNNLEIKDIPVIIITNLGEDTDKKRALELGAADFVIKASIDLEKLSKKIFSILNKNNEKK